MNMLLAMLKNLIPESGHYEIQFATYQGDTGKNITVNILEPAVADLSPKLLAEISITLPK